MHHLPPKFSARIVHDITPHTSSRPLVFGHISHIIIITPATRGNNINILSAWRLGESFEEYLAHLVGFCKIYLHGVEQVTEVISRL